jgi:SAM-dependent methyltransferase
MNPEYALRYRELYEKHWWWRAREDLIMETLEHLIPPGAGGAILDVGCGDGLFFERLSRLGSVEGIEMDPTGVTTDGPWASRIRVQPFDESFQPARRYSLVLLLDVLEHFANPLPGLRRALELLEPRGAVVVTVPAFRALWTSHDVLNRHFTRYTRDSLGDLARRAGSRMESSRYFFQWMSPLKLAVRLTEAVLRPVPATPRIPPGWLNRALYRLSRLEQRTISRWPVPFGSSLLAVLRHEGTPLLEAPDRSSP